VLKGPTVRRELYSDGAHRGYGDTDLLVSPADLPLAGATLEALGFELVLDHRDHARLSEPHAQEWTRPAGDWSVDLHWRPAGIGVAPERAWQVLAAETARFEIGGATGESLGRHGIALLVALHAAHHGRTHPKPLRDLARALDQFDAATWEAAGRLAAELDASEAFAAGLRLAPEGARTAARLGLPAVRSPRRRLMAGSQPPGSLGMLTILDAPTTRARARAVLAELLPAPELMRAASPLARRGRVGLGVAYAGRVMARAWQLPAAIRAVRTARNSTPPGH
jgi:hypothetical protein